MARPALSASRGFDLLELLALSAQQGLTLSELARMAGINPSSCHAVLGVLSERGYVVRNPASRRFTLGPLPVALSQAALDSNPLLARARKAADRAGEESGLPVLISAAIGEDIVGVHARPGASGRMPGLRLGERRAMRPPFGAPFLAWADDAAIEDWLAKAPAGDKDTATAERRAGMAAIRVRGFEVLLRSSVTSPLASEMAALAGSARYGSDKGASGFHALGPEMTLPQDLDPGRFYDVMLIAAPVFAADGACLYNLCLGPFPQPLNGAEIARLGEVLMRGCLEAMRT